MLRYIIVAASMLVSILLLTSCSPAPEPDGHAPEPQRTADVSAHVTKATALVDQLVSGQFSSVTNTFDVTMKGALPEAALAATWTQLQQQAGPYKERTDVREAQEQGYTTVYVTCVFERATLNTKVVFNAEDQVSGLFFLPV